MPIKFYCNQCDQRLSVASKKAGKSVSCPACHCRITIPFESQPRRTEQDELTTAPPTESDLTPQSSTPLDQEQHQLLDDLDDLGPLGESWDEILEGDWEQAAAEEEKQPAVAAGKKEQPKADEIIHPASQEPGSDVAPPSEEQSAPAEPVPAKPVSDATAAQTEPEPTTAPQAASAPSPAVSSQSFEDEDEDEDEDEGFSIRSVESEFEEMDLTPMVDVTFLLLIFFMITASFSLQKSIQVPPPNPDEDGVSQSLQTLDDFREESIIVEIDNNNAIYVDDTKLANPSEIVQAILDRRDQDGKPKRELVLSAHKA
ncbi:MAG: biopolymer transporter ExbD, partial [Planctomycetaceae bacterium]|nr:biopolymer transporter ExbD [Planctomycetaceae bacterium]